MPPRLRGLHHVTATVSAAQQDVDFYVGLLGLRLVKKTVNFDNRGVYHFYYGNTEGTPGTIMTTFPYQGMGVPPGRKGAGQITAVTFSIPSGSEAAWRRRLEGRGLLVAETTVRFGEPLLAFLDPSGLSIELIEAAGDPRAPWITPEIDSAMAIRGIHSLSLTVHSAGLSVELLRSLLGFAVVGEEENRIRVGVAGGGPGRALDIVGDRSAPLAVNGLGTVHHLALAVETAAEQLAYREEILRRGIPVTEVLDRQYFQSIYFREPGGVLYEIATIPPGFLVDEDPAGLGTALKLPPWEEANRAAIEARLPPVVLP